MKLTAMIKTNKQNKVVPHAIGRGVWEAPSPVVLQLLQGEDVFVEIFLQLLICVVNVKLFKTIHLWEETKIIKFNMGL